MSEKKIAVITGVGSSVGTGGALARRFTEGGYTVAMLARNADRLKRHGTGRSASPAT